MFPGLYPAPFRDFIGQPTEDRNGYVAGARGQILERVLKSPRSGDRAYRSAGFRPPPVGRVPSRGVRGQIVESRSGAVA